MLQIKCLDCKQEFTVKGRTTHNTWFDSGETIICESETFSECCEHLQAGGEFEVVDEDRSDGS